MKIWVKYSAILKFKKKLVQLVQNHVQKGQNGCGRRTSTQKVYKGKKLQILIKNHAHRSHQAETGGNGPKVAFYGQNQPKIHFIK